MAQTSLVLPGIFVALGAGIVLAVYLLLPGGRAPQASPDEAEFAAQGGIRGVAIDPARRSGRDDANDADAPELSPLPATGRAGERGPGAVTRPEQPPPEPVPPLVLDEAGLAAEAGYGELRERAAEGVRTQLDAQKSALRQACWKPSLTGGASSAEFAINASFGADGQLIAMGISDGRGAEGAAPSGVGACLRQQALALKIAPPGQGLSVDVPLTLP